MNYIKHLTIIIPFLILICPTFVLSEAAQKETLISDTSGPIAIKSNSLEIDNKRHVVTFMGDVEAMKDDITINCQKIVLVYQNSQEDDNSGKVRARVLEITATEKVRLSRPGGGIATAEKAVYYQDDEKVVLTGKPVVKQGSDFVEGSRITLFLKEDRSVVEGSEDTKARAVLFPKGEKR